MVIKKTITRFKRGVRLFLGRPKLFFERLDIHIGWFVWLLLKLPIKKRINGVLFEFDFLLSPFIKSMYFGWYDEEVVKTMANVLKLGDTFIDVGANIGYLSAAGASFVGKIGQVHSFEPALQYFQILERTIRMNPQYKIVVNQCALGEKEGKADFFISKENIGANTITYNSTIEETIEVPVYRLDSYIKKHKLQNITLIKIDVEGFEFPVLKGLCDYFESSTERPIIICEIFPFGYPKFGYSLTDLLEYMKKYGYRAYNIQKLNTEIDFNSPLEDYNVVFKA